MPSRRSRDSLLAPGAPLDRLARYDRPDRESGDGGEILMRGRWRLWIPGLVAMLLAVPIAVRAMAPEIWPSFTQSQADEGKQLYAERCANCHGAQLEGVGTPALTGSPFIRRWASGGKSVGDFYAKMRDSMPLMAPHSLTDDQY